MSDEAWKIDEAWTFTPSPEADRIVDRLGRRGRVVRPPHDLPYRRWLVARVQKLSELDATVAERQESEQWLDRIARATPQDLWAEYRGVASD